MKKTAQQQVDFLEENLMSRGWSGAAITPENASKLGGSLCRMLLIPKEKSIFLRKLVTDSLYETLTTDKLRLLCERAVYGKNQIEKDLPVGEMGLVRDEGAAECLEARMGVGAVGKVGLLFRFNEGRLAGLRKRYECSAGTIQYLGFVGGLKGRKYRAFHPRELVGFIFTVGVENKEGKIIVSRITADKKQRQKNATLKNKRNKSDCCADGTVCYYCSKSRKECSLSCHWSRWEKKDCPNGHTAWFDREICLFCAESLYKRAAGVYSFKPE